jgi:hypothetical protein
MLSIMDLHPTEPQSEKMASLTRLQKVLSTPRYESAEEPTSAACARERQFMHETAGSADVGWEPPVNPPLPPALAAPAAVDAECSGSGTPEFQHFAEQFAVSFLEDVTRVMRDAHALLTQDRRRVEAALDDLTRSLWDAQTVRSEMVRLREMLESLEQGREQLADKLGHAEDSLSASSSALSAFQSSRLQAERRLALQAGAIRTLHSAIGSREDLLDRILSTFQAVETPTGEAAGSESML